MKNTWRHLPAVRVTDQGRRLLLSGHPWSYRDHLAADPGLPPGELVAVLDLGDAFLGQGFYSPASRIALRMVTYSEKAVDRAFWEARLLNALAYRRRVVADTGAFRLIYGEADGFPGLVADSYAGHLALQVLHPAMESRLSELLELLHRHLSPPSVTLRNDAEVRQMEGLPLTVATVLGELPERLLVREGAVRFLVDIKGGQKTGLFLDQRENRLTAAPYSRGQVLDAFSYQGGFALHLAPQAGEVTVVESSAIALAQVQANASLNDRDNLTLVRANVFDFLKAAVKERRRFDVIVLDPPAFAKSRRERAGAMRGYREINRRAFQLLTAGGLLITCSCSYNLSEVEFLDLVRQAAVSAGRRVRLVERRGAARDHPALLTLPESRYLKCLFLEVD